MKLNSFLIRPPEQTQFYDPGFQVYRQGAGRAKEGGGLAAQISFLVSVPYKFYQLFDV